MLVIMQISEDANRPWLSVSGLNPQDVASAEASNFGFHVSELVLKSGGRVPMNRVGVTAIVGGNNVGKSTLLREIHTYLSRYPGQATSPNLILDTMSLDWQGTPADMLDWLGDSYAYTKGPGSDTVGFLAPNTSGAGRMSAQDLASYRRQGETGLLGPLSGFLTYFATAMQRFQPVQPVLRRADFGDPPTQPIHYLEQNNDLHQQFLAAAKSIFGIDLTLDPLSGELFFRVGKPSASAPPVDNIASGGEYLKQLRALPGLQNQGDGMQSAMALLMPVITATFPLILVDEPEAFLHPPQARILGATLARLAHSRKVQLLVATHDRHFLTGLLDAAEVDVSVVRLSRDTDTTHATHLAADTLRSAWESASLRHSNLLDGLFHRLVVIAENERDCRFYAAGLEFLDSKRTLPIRPHDVLFVSSSGKGNIAALSKVLRASGVPVVASPDLDFVNDEQTVAKLYSLHEGDWESLKPVYLAATAEFRIARTPRKNSDVLRHISRVLSENADANYTGQTKSDVTTALRVDNNWQRLKDYGVSGFRQERTKADDLLDNLMQNKIVPVHVGELENFAPELNLGKGDAWLAGALAAGAHERENVQKHLVNILKAAGYSIA